MTSTKKLENITRIQQELALSKTRLENAETSVQMYLERIEALTQEMQDILNS